MNYLAHIYLSGEDKNIIAGNFMGDFVKGNQLKDFSPEIQKGIQLHRNIDRYTDTHPIVKTTKAKLTPVYRHYAAVLVDIYYDHFLAKNWNKYHPTPLLPYTLDFYKTIMEFKDILPHAAQNMLQYMIPQNWLFEYSKLEGIQEVLNGMSRRTSFQSKMELAIKELTLHYNEIETEFTAFFEDIQVYVKENLSA